MGNIQSLYPSKYLKAADFEEPALLTIAELKIEEIAGGEHKPVLYFNERDKGMVLNKTNAKAIAKLYGSDFERWSDMQIVAFSTEVDLRGDLVEAIRLRAPKKPAKPKQRENPADDMDDDIPF